MKNKYPAIIFTVLIAFLLVVGTTPGEEAPAFAMSGAAIKQPAKIAEAQKKANSTKNIMALDQALKTGLPVIVKLGSDKCIPCRRMNPIMKELALEQNGKAVFLSLDVYENRELSGQAGVRVIPTILFYDKHGNPKAKSEGGMSKEDLLKAIEKLGLNK